MTDTLSQAARVIAETNLVSERGSVEEAAFAIAQALRDAGLLVGGEPVAWRMRQMNADKTWPITSWAYTHRKPEISGVHPYEVQPLVPLPQGGGET